MKIIKILIKSFLAGFAISLGGWLSLRAKFDYSSSLFSCFIFSFGLILICNFDFFLYTGKICYVFDKSEEKVTDRIVRMLLILVGNYLGCLFVGLLLRGLYLDSYIELFKGLDLSVIAKIQYPWYKVIGVSFFCGLLVYVAVEGFKNIQNNFGKYVVLVLAIGGFILAGFEHSIANMFYFCLNSSFGLDAFLFLILCVIGNSIGGVFIPLLKKLL